MYSDFNQILVYQKFQQYICLDYTWRRLWTFPPFWPSLGASPPAVSHLIFDLSSVRWPCLPWHGDCKSQWHRFHCELTLFMIQCIYMYLNNTSLLGLNYFNYYNNESHIYFHYIIMLPSCSTENWNLEIINYRCVQLIIGIGKGKSINNNQSVTSVTMCNYKINPMLMYWLV